MKNMWKKHFWKDVAERALKTAAQAAIAAIGTGTAFGDVNWIAVVSVIGMAVAASLLMSIASVGIGDHDSASLIDAE